MVRKQLSQTPSCCGFNVPKKKRRQCDHAVGQPTIMSVPTWSSDTDERGNCGARRGAEHSNFFRFFSFHLCLSLSFVWVPLLSSWGRYVGQVGSGGAYSLPSALSSSCLPSLDLPVDCLELREKKKIAMMRGCRRLFRRRGLGHSRSGEVVRLRAGRGK